MKFICTKWNRMLILCIFVNNIVHTYLRGILKNKTYYFCNLSIFYMLKLYKQNENQMQVKSYLWILLLGICYNNIWIILIRRYYLKRCKSKNGSNKERKWWLLFCFLAFFVVVCLCLFSVNDEDVSKKRWYPIKKLNLPDFSKPKTLHAQLIQTIYNDHH